jgi:hypothetical protein
MINHDISVLASSSTKWKKGIKEKKKGCTKENVENTKGRIRITIRVRKYENLHPVHPQTLEHCHALHHR